MPAKREWGNAKWFYLHTMAGAYSDTPTEEEKDKMLATITNDFATLPCSICANHALKYLRDHPLRESLVNSEQFQRYLYDMHNSVNERRKKDGETVNFSHTFEEVLEAFRPTAWKAFGGYPMPDTYNEMTVAQMQDAVETHPKHNQAFSNALREQEQSSSMVFYLLVSVIVALLLILIVVLIVAIRAKRANAQMLAKHQ